MSNGTAGAGTTSYGFDWLYLCRFARLHRIFFPGFRSLTSALFATLIVVSLTEQYLVYRVGLISGQFYKVLGSKDLVEFKEVTIMAVLIIVAMSLVKSFRIFVTRLMTVGWRKWVTRMLHSLYFTNIRYYELNVLASNAVDNPDQRMTADVNTLCSKYGSIIADLILAPFLIVYYSYSAFTRSGWIGPVAMFSLFIVATCINKMLMSPIVNLTVEQERREGDFRFKHVSVRVNAESLAFHGSVFVEARKVDNKLTRLLDTQQRVCLRQFFLDLSTNTFDYLGSIASFLAISVSIFSGAYDDLNTAELAQVISENAFVCMYLIYQFSKLVDMSVTVSSMAGVTHRIMELAEKLAEMPKEDHRPKLVPAKDDEGPCDFEPSVGSGEAKLGTDVLRSQSENLLFYTMTDVTFSAPGSTLPLVAGLSLDIKLGDNLMIMGRSSAGKSSIFRILRGIWQPAEGIVQRHFGDTRSIFFLPQKPFFTDGSLRDQIVYPQSTDPHVIVPDDDRFMLDMLQELGLDDVLRRCCGDLDYEPQWSWYDVLSPGEMQRLAFIRLFLHRPSLAFLDEATSALSSDIESLLYQRCLDLGITLVSVGHRENLRAFHPKVLHIGLPNGAWHIEENVNESTLLV